MRGLILVALWTVFLLSIAAATCIYIDAPTIAGLGICCYFPIEGKKIEIYIISFLISLTGGVFAATWIDLLRKGFDPEFEPRELRDYPLDWSIGGLERIICTALVIWAPHLVVVFVGPWIALKFALNWKRQEGKNAEQKDRIARKGLSALVGNAVSFAIAILAGLFARLPPLEAWQYQCSVAGS